jgi:glycerol-3-phosphate dehydrogenase
LSPQQFQRLKGRYGNDVDSFVDGAQVAVSGSLLRRIHDTDTLWQELVWACQHETVQHLDDLMLRRTRIGLLLKDGGAEYFERIKDLVSPVLGWDDMAWSKELERYQKIILRYYSLPLATVGRTDMQGAA